MTINKSLYIFGILIVFILLGGCTKFVNVDPPITELVTSSVFASDQTAISAMNGIYGFLVSDGFANGGNHSITFLTGLSSDELINYSSDNAQIPFYQNELTSTNFDVVQYFWTGPYQLIYDANAMIEGLEGSATISPAIKQELTGEAKFIRAFCNFYLTSMYRDIPLIDTTDYKANSIAARTGRDAVYQQIVRDLKDAQALMATDYSYADGERVKPNAWAARAMLARVYLFANDWTNAADQASAVIGETGQYEIVQDLNDVFLGNSNETIWQLKPTIPGYNTMEGNTFILTGPPVYAALSPQLINAFDPSDLRRQNWIADTTIGSDTYYYPFKYKIVSADAVTEYSMVLRLAEQYLIRAEARAHLNDIPGSQADINIIRQRAGLPDVTAADQSSLLNAVLKERQLELFTEWGHRWFDLIRTGQAIPVLGAVKNNFQALDTLYPIPQAEIQKDRYLTQNEGY